MSEVGDPGKRVRTSANSALGSASEREPSLKPDLLDLDMELNSEMRTLQGSFQQWVSIQLSGEIKSAPKGQNSLAPKQQLMFDDSQWKHLETKEEKADQRKVSCELDNKMWGPVKHTEEERKA